MTMHHTSASLRYESRERFAASRVPSARERRASAISICELPQQIFPRGRRTSRLRGLLRGAKKQFRRARKRLRADGDNISLSQQGARINERDVQRSARCFSRNCGGFWHRVADHEAAKRGNNNHRCGRAGDDIRDDMALREDAPNEGTSLTHPMVSLCRLCRAFANRTSETNI